ncbi:hypothetical protein BDQ17DRAFT_1369325 [Cyathus striatus]|nr:hypothetical protein BDQ17DRAFT_1369325 [Cyathus striatus]
MESIATAYVHLIGNYKFQTSNYVVFIYDHLLTLPEEVEKIWSQPFSFATLLFYINRYITHCQFIILQVEFYETNWPISVCDRYVKFAGATTLCLVAVAELIMILRVYALYLGNKYVLVFLLSVLVGQIIVMAWSVHFGIRVPLPPGFPGCVLTGSSSWMTGLWAAPVCTDTCIFLLTVWRAVKYRKNHGISGTMQIIIRDGTIYFLVIFGANLMNCLIYLLAVEDLKAAGASFSQILTSILITRLQLNLRRNSSGSLGSKGSDNRNIPVVMPNIKSTGQETTTFFTIGNLGGELEGTFFLDSDMSKREDGEEYEMKLTTACRGVSL